MLENLGEINLLLTDKTGTLTENQMILRSLYCDDRVWSIEAAKKQRLDAEVKISAESIEWIHNHLDEEPQPVDVAINRSEAKPGKRKHKKKKEKNMHNFLLCIALCHSGRINKGGKNSYICYSEDERCLLLCTKQFGYQFYHREHHSIVIKIRGQLVRFGVKAVFPFDSHRKMMSVVCKTYEGEYIMFTKGADSSVTPRLALKNVEK